jgi:hypothetical protein
MSKLGYQIPNFNGHKLEDPDTVRELAGAILN